MNKLMLLLGLCFHLALQNVIQEDHKAAELDCTALCADMDDGYFSDDCCSSEYCVCVNHEGTGPLPCQEGQVFCENSPGFVQACQDESTCGCCPDPTTEATKPTTEATSPTTEAATSTSAPELDCTALCADMDTGCFSDDCCSSEYCVCVNHEGTGPLSCQEGQVFCENSPGFVQACQDESTCGCCPDPTTEATKPTTEATSPTTEAATSTTTTELSCIALCAADSSMKCPAEGKFGPFPNMYDCSEYWICDDGCAVETQCDEGTLFDMQSKTCVESSNVVCGPRPCSSPSHCDCLSMVPVNIWCQENSFEHVVPDMEDCASYYSCTAGCFEHKKCQRDYLYNIEYKLCDHNNGFKCGERPCIDPERCPNTTTSTTTTTTNTTPTTSSTSTTTTVNKPTTSSTTTTTTTTTITTSTTTSSAYSDVRPSFGFSSAVALTQIWLWLSCCFGPSWL